MWIVLLTPGVNPTAVNKIYQISYIRFRYRILYATINVNRSYILSENDVKGLLLLPQPPPPLLPLPPQPPPPTPTPPAAAAVVVVVVVVVAAAAAAMVL
jgi:hypothetical protein